MSLVFNKPRISEIRKKFCGKCHCGRNLVIDKESYIALLQPDSIIILYCTSKKCLCATLCINGEIYRQLSPSFNYKKVLHPDCSNFHQPGSGDIRHWTDTQNGAMCVCKSCLSIIVTTISNNKSEPKIFPNQIPFHIP